MLGAWALVLIYHFVIMIGSLYFRFHYVSMCLLCYCFAYVLFCSFVTCLLLLYSFQLLLQFYASLLLSLITGFRFILSLIYSLSYLCYYSVICYYSVPYVHFCYPLLPFAC